MEANAKSSTDRRSSTVRRPALAKARAVASGRPFRSQAIDANQYSSNDEDLRSIGLALPHPGPFIGARSISENRNTSYDKITKLPHLALALQT
jgi:hypothetical protein